MVNLRGVTQEKKDECRIRGNQAADEFIMFIETEYGGKCYLSTPESDMFEHVDFDYITKDGNKIRIDFKSIKYISKFADDDSPPDQYNILELVSVNGNDGWIYGYADYICFETLDSWLWVPRKKLVQFVDENVKNESPIIGTICTPMYHLRRYQRINRKDVIVVVTKEELIKLSIKISKKPSYVTEKV